MTTTQTAMIQAAASIAAMMPAKPAKKLMGDRTEQLVFSVYEQAAKAAYVRAAQECFGTAYTAAGGGVDCDDIFAIIEDKSTSLADLVDMCVPGYAWGGAVVTL